MSNQPHLGYGHLGFGLGLRSPHYGHFLNARPRSVDWLEIISDNYIHAHSGYHDMLADLRQDYPIVMHGVGLSIGTMDALDTEYLNALKILADKLDAAWVSDHLCFTGINGENSHDLLPIPYTEEALDHLVPRIHQVQHALKRELVLENASSYIEFDGAALSEPEFFTELHARTGCGLLLDINNVHVSSFNHGWDARAYIDAVPSGAIRQYHLAGHTDHGDYLFDTHNAPVADSVWALYDYAQSVHGERATMIEWDADIPPFEVLEAELNKVRTR